MIVSELSDLASRLSLGPIHRFGRLAVVPLIDRTAKPSGWLTLDAALAGGEVEVTQTQAPTRQHVCDAQMRWRSMENVRTN